MAGTAEKKRNLGRGLAALLGDEAEDYAALDRARGLKNVTLDQLTPSSAQPRTTFEEEGLKSLANSVREKGVIQPILVRRKPGEPNRYEIIAGERRWRAAQMASLHQIPVIVKELSDKDAIHVALIENIQRQDLNPLEEARAFKRLLAEHQDTQEAIAKDVGKSRSYVANTLRLLNLPGSVQKLLEAGQLSAGHGRTLLNSDFPEVLAQQILDRHLSVRDAERLSKQARESAGQTPAKRKAHLKKDADTIALEKDLTNLLGLKVAVSFKGKGGALTIRYNNLEQLDALLARLKMDSS